MHLELAYEIAAGDLSWQTPKLLGNAYSYYTMHYLHMLWGVAMQAAYPSDAQVTLTVFLPLPDVEVIRGCPWGEAGGLFTPAYWAANCALFAATNGSDGAAHRLGSTLAEEMAACLLGGHGMPAELAAQAYFRVRDAGLLCRVPAPSELESVLSSEFVVNGSSRRYRFPRQKARYLAHALATLAPIDASSWPALALRERLMEMPGIGPKTASWIVRNWMDSDEVAILDIHILRALRLLDLIEDVRLPRNYVEIEKVFLRFASAIGVRPSVLDAVMWSHMRRWGHIAYES